MEVNVVRVFEDKDFLRVKELCDNHADWDLVYEKKQNQVWTKGIADSDFLMIKVTAYLIDFLLNY